MEFDVNITESLLRRVFLRRLFRHWPVSLLAVCLIVFAVSFDLRHGRLGTASIIALTAIAFQLLIYVSSYIRHRKSIAEWKRLQGDAPVHYELSTETMKTTSNLGSSELRWHVFRELLEHPDFILLGMGRAGHLTLPGSDIPAGARAFIRDRFASHGIPVRKA